MAQPRQRLSLPNSSTVRTINYPVRRSKDDWELTPFHRLHLRNTCVNGSDARLVQCRSKVSIAIQRGNETIDIWRHEADNSFVTQPALAQLSESMLATGFVIKFWNWTIDDSKVSKVRLFANFELLFFIRARNY